MKDTARHPAFAPLNRACSETFQPGRPSIGLADAPGSSARWLRNVLLNLPAFGDAGRDAPPRPIHLGFQSGTDHMRRYLRQLRALGVSRIGLTLRFNGADIEGTMNKLADETLPDVHD